ncbi:MAG: acetyl-CoA decarbonylase/synthase complex subunit delta [Candidatus Omnitrophota bacterium]|nr:acetyl-CoA decarbonylase/synthase complex subunit delta [Candidatus Omnitrophota bacterium]
MSIPLVLEKYSGKINTLTIGTAKNGIEDRPFVIKIGGEESLPFLFQEGSLPNKPVIAHEIWDIAPCDWPEELTRAYADVLGNPLEWAQKCIREYKAEMLCIRLQGAHPDFGNKTAQEEAKLISQLLKTIEIPLIIIGCQDNDKDNLILAACSEAAKGRRCLIGNASTDNYKTLTASVLADGHNIIAESPIDINIAKQLNILISDMGLGLDRIVINPTVGALGYGLEYAYSIMERSRLAALSGDKAIASPFICFVAQESWRAKEAKALEQDFPSWGPEVERGIIWEIITASALLQAGADILVMRHPLAIEKINNHITNLMKVKAE